MRKEIFRLDEERTRAFLEAAEVVHVALPGPILRTLNFVLDEGALCFHGAPAGEKLQGLGQQAVAAAERILATIPSTWIDPVRACPATIIPSTWMRTTPRPRCSAPAWRTAR